MRTIQMRIIVLEFHNNRVWVPEFVRVVARAQICGCKSDSMQTHLLWPSFIQFRLYKDSPISKSVL